MIKNQIEIVSVLDAIKIFEKYPDLFEDCWTDLKIGYGWLPLVQNLCEVLSYISNPEDLLKIKDIKEKFGLLHIDFSVANNSESEDLTIIIQGAEKISYHICEACGERGKLCCKDYVFFKTLCDACSVKNLYIKI